MPEEVVEDAVSRPMTSALLPGRSAGGGSRKIARKRGRRRLSRDEAFQLMDRRTAAKSLSHSWSLLVSHLPYHQPGRIRFSAKTAAGDTSGCVSRPCRSYGMRRSRSAVSTSPKLESLRREGPTRQSRCVTPGDGKVVRLHFSGFEFSADLSPLSPLLALLSITAQFWEVRWGLVRTRG